MRRVCKILDEHYGPLPVSLESLLDTAIMHVPFKHYTDRPWGVLPPFAAKNAYPGTVNESEYSKVQNNHVGPMISIVLISILKPSQNWPHTVI